MNGELQSHQTETPTGQQVPQRRFGAVQPEQEARTVTQQTVPRNQFRLGGDVAFVLNRNGVLESYAIRAGGRFPGSVYRSVQHSSGTWSNWNVIDPSLRDTLGVVDALQNPDDTMEAFSIGAARTPVHSRQLEAGGSWSSWMPLGGGLDADGRDVDEIHVQGVVRPNGEAIVLGRGAAGGLNYVARDRRNNWTRWQLLGNFRLEGVYEDIVLNPGERLDVFVRTSNGSRLYQITQWRHDSWSQWNQIV